MSFNRWFNERLPVDQAVRDHLTEYYAPKNFNFWYYFGSLAMVVLVLQIVTGILLAMNYKPDADLAFASVEYIMRDVWGGWFVRYMHSTGASFFFIVIYLHMFRGLMYGSYKNPRELIWIFGMVIYVAMMATAFFGYLLPWGQMSYWGAQVIVNLFETLPVVGGALSEWIRGDYVISDITLNRFYAFHYLVPLHQVGSNNPDGIEIKKGPKGNRWSKDAPADGVPFHPYFTVKDVMGMVVFLALFFGVVFFIPEMGGYFIEQPNFEPANPLKTPEHIAPVWYFTPYYAILRAVPSFAGTQVWGVLAMGAAIVVFFFLPWLDRSPVKSVRYKGPLTRLFLIIFAITFLVLGWLGTLAPTVEYTAMAQFLTVVYFMFFLLMPCYSGTGDNLGFSGFILFVIALLLTLGGLYLWWLKTPDLAASMKWFYSIASVALLFLFGVKPGWIKADTVKPVPERLT
jgi:ubiquinol-cytochrome c reductase cytochrome b subunit